MVFYFSGTGNSEWAAKEIAMHTEDRACDIIGLKEMPEMGKEKQIGFVFPVYAWGAPEPVTAFAKKLQHPDLFTFGVCTCGSEAGRTMRKFSAIYPLDSCYSLVMPSNYIVGTDTEDEETVLRKLQEADEEIQRISQEILKKEKVYRVREGACAKLKSGPVNFGFNKFARKTQPFYVTNTCDGCGLCAKDCPASTIVMTDQGPKWGKLCYQCMKCINQCPKQAIQYGKVTESRRRYTMKRYIEQGKA